MEWTVAGETYEWSANWFAAWAAVLQAVLSAGAIVFAFKLQDRELARRKVDRLAIQVAALKSIADRCARTIGFVAKNRRRGELDRNNVARYIHELDADEVTLAAIDVFAFEDQRLIDAASLLRRAVRTTLRRLGYVQDKLRDGKPPVQEFDLPLKQVRQAAKALSDIGV